MKKLIRAELIENRVVVWNIEDSRKLYSEGFYGKPLGVPKPKGTNFDSPLILDLIEALYLLKKKKIVIYHKKLNVSYKELVKRCEKEYVGFKEKFIVYQNLRDLGYVVAPGIKFGCDFAVYKKGPGIDHAPFLVDVMKPNDYVTATSMVLSGRLATTVRKQFVIASVGRIPQYISFDWWKG